MNYTRLQNLNKDLTQNNYNLFFDTYIHTHRCKKCNSPSFTFHGTYHRHVYYSPQEAITIDIQRVKCKSCHATQVILPPQLIPFKRYQLKNILQLIVLLHFMSISKVARENYFSRGYLYFLLKHFFKWHQICLDVLNISLPPPNLAEFVDCYYKQFSYCFMQVLPSWFFLFFFFCETTDFRHYSRKDASIILFYIILK